MVNLTFLSLFHEHGFIGIGSNKWHHNYCVITKQIHCWWRGPFMLMSLRHQYYKTDCTLDAISVSHRSPGGTLAAIEKLFVRVWEDKLDKGLSKTAEECDLAFGVWDSGVKGRCFICRACALYSSGHGLPVRLTNSVCSACWSRVRTYLAP